jgi:hypothetical protein
MASPHNFLQIIVKAHEESDGASLTNKITNVWTYYRSGASATPSKVAAVTAFKSAVLTPLMNCLSIAYAIDYLDYRWIDDYQDRTISETSTTVGAVAGDNLPAFVDVVLQLQGALRGSGSHGSKYFAPIPESHTDQNVLTGAAVTLWNTFADAYLAGFTSSDSFTYIPFIAQARPQGVPFTYQTVTGQPVFSTKLNTTLSSLKSRKHCACG